MQNIDIHKFYTVCEAAEILGISDKTLYQYIKEKKITYYTHLSDYRIKGLSIYIFVEKHQIRAEY